MGGRSYVKKSSERGKDMRAAILLSAMVIAEGMGHQVFQDSLGLNMVFGFFILTDIVELITKFIPKDWLRVPSDSEDRR